MTHVCTSTELEKLAVDPTVPSEGAAENPIVLSGVGCTGSESTLSSCSRVSPISQCSHSLDAGARCSKDFCLKIISTNPVQHEIV